MGKKRRVNTDRLIGIAGIIVGIVGIFIGMYFVAQYYDIENEFNRNCVINSSNVVQSINQAGGITASNVNIESPKRVIDQEFIGELNKYLPKSKNNKISITSVMGDSEAFQFANEMKNYLEMQGWEVEGVNQAVYDKPVIGIFLNPEQNGDIAFIVGSKE